jgi:osmotically-inducible protein OsmY
MSEGTVHAQVRVDRVTLTGEVEWDYQKHEIERMVRRVRGVAGINNIIVVTRKPIPSLQCPQADTYVCRAGIPGSRKCA